MKRRVTVEATDDDGATLLPEELTFENRRDWPNGRAFYEAQRAWFQARGIENPHVGHEASKIHSASRRAHAQTLRELDALGRLQHRNLHGSGQHPDTPLVRDVNGEIV